MNTKPMGKTRAKQHLATMKREVTAAQQALTPPRRWVAHDLGIDIDSPEYKANKRRQVRNALDEIDRLSALLRQGLAEGGF